MLRYTAADGILREGIAAHAFPSASYAVSCHGERNFGALGRFTYETESPSVTAETIYDLASLTKVVATAAAAMLLYDRGLLSLDARVCSFFPDFSRGDDRRQQVTVRMLLQHSSGLPAYVKLFEKAQGKESMLHAAAAVPLTANPGERAAYSDIGFILLGRILEIISGQSLDQFCARELFRPLAINCMYLPPDHLKPKIPPTELDTCYRHRVIQGEVNDENAAKMGGVAGHAGLFGSSADLIQFAEFMLAAGTPLVRRETVSLFTTRSDQPPGSSFALGWDTPSGQSSSGKYFSPRSFGHLGFTGTSLWIDPERQLAVVLLTNRTWPDRSSQLIKQLRPRFHDAVVEALS